MIGAFVVKLLAKKFRTTSILFFFTTMVAGDEFMMFFVENPVITLSAFAILGFSLGSIFPTAMVIFQKQMPKEYHGRFFSCRNMLERILFQVILLSAGAFLDIIGLQSMLIIFGVVSFSLILLFILYANEKQKYCIGTMRRNVIVRY